MNQSDGYSLASCSTRSASDSEEEDVILPTIRCATNQLTNPKSSSSGISEDHKHQESLDDLASNQLLNQCMIHLDVDCFYCQCEELEDKTLKTVPLAIGQKHIIVTCNYIARSYGVKKLMSRVEAKRICPTLFIREGSDLEKYRRASRKIYTSFRDSIRNISSLYHNGEEVVRGSIFTNNKNNPVKKGGMDEMFADISHAVNECCQQEISITTTNGSTSITNKPTSNHNIQASDHTQTLLYKIPEIAYVFGDSHNHPKEISISEDQSGAQVNISMQITNDNDRTKNGSSTRSTSSHHSSSHHIWNMWGDDQDRQKCMNRLRIAAYLAGQIRDQIQSQTQFSCCVGVSVSPMLAKLASELKVSN